MKITRTSRLKWSVYLSNEELTVWGTSDDIYRDPAYIPGGFSIITKDKNNFFSIAKATITITFTWRTRGPCECRACTNSPATLGSTGLPGRGSRRGCPPRAPPSWCAARTRQSERSGAWGHAWLSAAAAAERGAAAAAESARTLPRGWTWPMASHRSPLHLCVSIAVHLIAFGIAHCVGWRVVLQEKQEKIRDFIYFDFIFLWLMINYYL